MTNDVTLGADVRQNLNSIQRTEGLLNRTQSRLATGRKVNSAVDDAVAYFQGRALEDRAKDLIQVKDRIATGVSTITAAMNGLETAEKLVVQMKGIALAAKGEATPSARYSLYLEYDKLRTQLDAVTNDSHYNGASLIGNPSNDLTITLSPPGSNPESTLTVPANTTTASTLGLSLQAVTVTAATYNSTPEVKNAMDSWVTAMGAVTSSGAIDSGVTVTGLGAWNTLDPYGSGIGNDTYIPLYSDSSDIMTLNDEYFSSISGHTAGQWQYQTALVLQDFMATGGTMSAMVGDLGSGLNNTAFTTANFPNISVDIPAYPWDADTGFTTNIDMDLAACEGAISTLRSSIASFGTNIALLRVRDDYTSDSVNTLTEGATKLTNADLNEEGANMVALQTRSQLGVQAISFSGQSARSIMQLFN